MKFRILHSAFCILHLRSRSGVALIGIIAAIVLVGLLGIGVLRLVSVALMESIQALEWNQAFFAAESGVSAMKAYMATGGVLPGSNVGVVGQATFSAGVNSERVITSVGRQSEAQWTSIYGSERNMVLVYYEKNSPYPRYRTWSNIRGLSINEPQALSVNGYSQWQKIVANPLTNAFLLVAQNAQREIWAQTYANGTWLFNTRLNAAGLAPDASARGFDVAYESLSGRGLVVYSVGSSNPQYRIWTSNTWSAPGLINVGATNPVRWIRLIAKPESNEIMCLARWRKTTNPRGNYSSAIVWNGSVWTNYTPLERSCNSDIACETIDAAYSTNLALVVYINGADPAARKTPKYKIYNAVSRTWSGQSNMVSMGKQSAWIRVEFSSDGKLAYVGLLLDDNKKLQGTYWRGSSWDDYYNFGSLDTSARRDFDIAWSSQTNTLMVVYSPNANAQQYMLATGGGSSIQYGSLVPTDDGRWCVLKADPASSAFCYLALDDQDAVNFQRWNGTAWSLFPELENNSDLDYLSIDMAFGR